MGSEWTAAPVDPRPARRARASSLALVLAALCWLAPVGAVTAAGAATPPQGLGGDGSASLGNQVNTVDNASPPTCPQYQPSQTGACAPQPMLWTAINSPYNDFANGDPYSVKCARNGSSGSAANCDDPTAANGARNPLYRKTGYAYAIDVAPADVGVPLTLGIYDAGQFQRTVSNGATDTNGNVADCNKTLAPFNTTAYTSMTTQNCQTGDSNTASPLEVQVFDNDGTDTAVGYDSPLSGCRLVVPAAASATTYKNKWVQVCTFTPTKAGIYPFRTRSSAIPGFTDVGTGINGFALRVDGGTATRLYALDDLSIWTNTPASTAKFYLANLTSEWAGRTLAIDLYDVGDGNSSQTAYVLSIKGPPGGAPSRVPGNGTTIPAAGLATGCRYNATPSATKGPATPDTATNCAVTTKLANTSGGIYNNSWLRITVQIDPGYSCTTDCWWTIQENFGTAGLPTDRTVWSVTYLETPVLRALSTRGGPTTGGTPITITGDHLADTTSVTVGNVAATNVTVVDDHTVTAVTPPHAAGLTNVVVTTTHGTSVGGQISWFTYHAPVGNLDGTVTDTAGHPLGGIGVVWSPADHQAIAGYAYTNPDGTFTGTGLPAGDYKVLIVDPALFQGTPSFYWPQFYDGIVATDLDAQFATVPTITITDGTTLHLTPQALTLFTR